MCTVRRTLKMRICVYRIQTQNNIINNLYIGTGFYLKIIENINECSQYKLIKYETIAYNVPT